MDTLVQLVNRNFRVLPVPSSSMAGRFGTDGCRVLDGGVLARWGQPPRPLDGAQGVALAGQTRVTEPDGVEVHPVRIVRATFNTIQQPIHDSEQRLLRRAVPPAFSAGPGVLLQCTLARMRPCAMAGRRGDRPFAVHVRRIHADAFHTQGP